MLVAPPHWNAGSESLAQVGRGASLLMLDYDGTLAPFRDDRMQALPWPGVAARLDRLSKMPSVHLALVTGRSARELASLLPLQHAVRSGARMDASISPQTAFTPRPPLRQRSRRFSINWKRRSRKPGSVHRWSEKSPASPPTGAASLLTPQEKIERTVRDVYLSAGERAGLQLLVFDGGVEVRSDSISKGDAALHMVTRFPTATAAYLGDDTTDEDAFAVLRGRALTLLVRPQPSPQSGDLLAQAAGRPARLLGCLDSRRGKGCRMMAQRRRKRVGYAPAPAARRLKTGCQSPSRGTRAARWRLYLRAGAWSARLPPSSLNTAEPGLAAPASPAMARRTIPRYASFWLPPPVAPRCATFLSSCPQGAD